MSSTMNIFGYPGRKVIFTGAGGYDHQKADAIEDGLVVGQEYTVNHCDVGSSSTKVYLREFPTRYYTSCLFEDPPTPDQLEIRALKLELARANKVAAHWEGLMNLCGHWQDDSFQTVKLVQDDATRTCIIVVGDREQAKSFHGSSFESALQLATMPNELNKDTSNG